MAKAEAQKAEVVVVAYGETVTFCKAKASAEAVAAAAAEAATAAVTAVTSTATTATTAATVKQQNNL